MSFRLASLLLLVLSLGLSAQEDKAFSPDRCEVVPLAGHEVSLRIDGVEKTRWHFGGAYPRPFLFPLRGPSGAALTRMGHPGASNHDHHRSVWFAHHEIEGKSFWADGKGTRIRQKQWFAYEDGKDEAIMASLLGWFDEEGKELLEQECVIALLPLEGGEHAIEVQVGLRPGAGRESTRLGKTNFGLLAVRVAKTISEHFGGGRLTNSEGAVGEKAIFGKPARWVDYSGPVAVGKGPERRVLTEGITYFDHPGNPRHPTVWHVRSDGWMGASLCMAEGLTLEKDKPLVLRYLLHAHAGAYSAARAERVAQAFAERPGFEIGKRGTPHRRWEVWRTQ